LNGAYKAVFATRLSYRVNPILDEEGGLPRKKSALALSLSRGITEQAFAISEL
jgi:hypothetical protein